MHDTYAFSVNAVEDIIDNLKEDGFYFVTVDELLVINSINEDKEVN